jgi:hypothetical protein
MDDEVELASKMIHRLPKKIRYDAVIFDLLTAPLSSWSLWNDVAGDASLGWDWRKRYLKWT